LVGILVRRVPRAKEASAGASSGGLSAVVQRLGRRQYGRRRGRWRVSVRHRRAWQSERSKAVHAQALAQRARNGKALSELDSEVVQQRKERWRDWQARNLDAHLRGEREHFLEPTATRQIRERVRLAVAVAVLVKGSKDRARALERFVQPLRLLGPGAVVVEDFRRRFRVRNEHAAAEAHDGTKHHHTQDVAEKFELHDRVAQHVERQREGEEETVEPAAKARHWRALQGCVGKSEVGAPRIPELVSYRVEGFGRRVRARAPRKRL